MSTDAISEEPLPTRVRQRLLTRRLVLDAALEEIAERGLAGARIGEIARKAGVTRPTIYAHFPVKEDFLRELETRTRATLLEALRDRLGSDGGPHFTRRLVDALFDLLNAAQPVLRRESFALIVREPASADWTGIPLFGFLTERFAAARARGEVTADVPDAELTHIALTALFGFLVVEAEPSQARREAAQRMMDLLIRGAGADHAGS